MQVRIVSNLQYLGPFSSGLKVGRHQLQRRSRQPQLNRPQPNSQRNQPTKTTTKFTTRTSSKPTSTDWRPETTATTDLIATAAPQDGHSQTALIVGLVMGVLVLVAIIAVSLVTVKKRNIKIPGIDAVRGLINPGYSKFDDGAMVRPLDSLRAKLECLSFPGQFEGIVFPGE